MPSWGLEISSEGRGEPRRVCEQEGGMIRAVCQIDRSRARIGDDFGSWVRVGDSKVIEGQKSQTPA